MQNKLKRFEKIYPWYGGFSGDLLFWIAVDSLFLQFVKGLTLPEIVLTTTISHVVSIIFQIPILKIVESIGNTKSVKVGAFLALTAALLFTFGNSIYIITFAKILSDMAQSFKSMLSVVLEHNLTIQEREHEFIKNSTKANTVYAVTTMLISVVASYLFNLNHYLPNTLCIMFCVLCVFMSVFMIDYSERNNADVSINKKVKNKFNIKFSKLILLAIISFGVFFAIVSTGQENAKLFIQEELLKVFSKDNTSLIIGAVLLVSRIVRVVANIIFAKLYKIIGDKTGILFSGLMLTSFLLLIVGYFVEGQIIFKFVLMGAGYVIILFSRDPFKLYIHNLVLRNTADNEHQKVMMALDLSRKVLTALLSVTFTMTLVKFPMLVVIFLYAVLEGLEIIISIYLLSLIKKNIKSTEKEKVSA